MNQSVEQPVQEFMQRLVERSPNEPEFHQAVREVVTSVMPMVLANRRYRDEAILERLSEPDRITTFRVTWEDDAGRVHVNRGHRVQWTNALGPYKGGLRFHPTVKTGVLKFLGFEQTFKNSLTGLPMGGAKGGADFDPKGKSEREVMRFCHAFMDTLYTLIGEHTDVPAGDIGVGEREISFMFGRYIALQDRWAGVMTGKGVSFGGSAGRAEATGYGCVIFAKDMLEANREGLAGTRIAISGSGNVALFAAERALQLEAKVLTVSDSEGFLHFEEGLNHDQLEQLKDLKFKRRARLSEAVLRGAKFYSDQRPWCVPCDVAMPCATQNELDLEDARTLSSNGVQAVCEGANMPTTFDAVEHFRGQGVLVAPGKAANAGGVAVSGLEQTQNQMRLSWTRDEVQYRLEQIMRRIHDDCAREGRKEDGTIDYVDGANIAGFKKVADVLVGYGLQ